MRFIYILWIVTCCALYVDAADTSQQINVDIYTPGNTISQEFRVLIHNPVSISARNHRIYNRIYSILNPWAMQKGNYLTAEDKGIVPLGKPYSTLSNEQKQELKNRAEEVARSQWQQFPLSCFYECDSETCVLSRSRNPEYRDVYDRSVADHIVQAAKNHPERPVRFVSIGSGFLLQVMRILGLAFNQKPDLNIVVDCIDPIYAQSDEKKSYSSPSDFILKAQPHKSRSEPVFDLQGGIGPNAQPEYLLHVLSSVYKGISISPQNGLGEKGSITLYTYTDMSKYMSGIKGVHEIQELAKKLQIDPVSFVFPDVITSSDLEGLGLQVLDKTQWLIVFMSQYVNKKATGIYLLENLGIGRMPILTPNNLIDKDGDFLQNRFRIEDVLSYDQFKKEKQRLYNQ